jgi:lysozyme
MDKSKAIAVLSDEEGRIPHVYTDHLGYWTIGVGHLVDKRRGGGLPDHIIDALLEYDIDEKWGEVLARWPWMADLDDARQFVFLSMAFQMGTGGLGGFHSTLGAAERGDWSATAAGMKNSAWAKQTPERAGRLAKQMETGEWVSRIKLEDA